MKIRRGVLMVVLGCGFCASRGFSLPQENNGRPMSDGDGYRGLAWGASQQQARETFRTMRDLGSWSDDNDLNNAIFRTVQQGDARYARAITDFKIPCQMWEVSFENEKSKATLFFDKDGFFAVKIPVESQEAPHVSAALTHRYGRSIGRNWWAGRTEEAIPNAFWWDHGASRIVELAYCDAAGQMVRNKDSTYWIAEVNPDAVATGAHLMYIELTKIQNFRSEYTKEVIQKAKENAAHAKNSLE